MKSESMRLQKFLAHAGVASRRQAEIYIADGRVSVNGVIVQTQGTQVDPLHDVVCVDTKQIMPPVGPKRTIMLNKPRGYICSSSDAQGTTVYNLIHEISERMVPVGRLDKDTEGLLLMSNDGDLVDRLTHPRYGQRKVYHVTVANRVNERTLKQLNDPMTIDDYPIKPVTVRTLSEFESGSTELEFILTEGRNRQIRKMCRMVGMRIVSLVRTQIVTLPLGGLAVGEWRDLTPSELAGLSGTTTALDA